MNPTPTPVSDELNDYLDGILSQYKPGIQLDAQQRAVVLDDSDRCLVVAGAGAGKSTTIAAKVKYLVDRQGIAPEEILVLSFSRKAVGSLQETFDKDHLNIPCKVSTFHSLGNDILRHGSTERLKIVEAKDRYEVIRNYLRNTILQDPAMVDNLDRLFPQYFNTKGQKNPYETKGGDIVRSKQEVAIANFLYDHDISYEYEPIYPYFFQTAAAKGAYTPYTPDFRIWDGDRSLYIEHFGVNQDGTSTLLSTSRRQAYLREIQDKQALHQAHGTELICTYSEREDIRQPGCPHLLENLQAQLEAHHFPVPAMRSRAPQLSPLPVNRFARLLDQFISNFKGSGYSAERFKQMYRDTENVRTRLFLKVCHKCYLEYERWMIEQDGIDFDDMINDSTALLLNPPKDVLPLPYRYIIIDEYQDISKQRLNLIGALSDMTQAKIMAVGDDWQSIYGFSGSDPQLFQKFREQAGDSAVMLKIENTYRNSQELIDIAGQFVMKNQEQISKSLHSGLHLSCPVVIKTYETGSDRDENIRAIAEAAEAALQDILANASAAGKRKASVLFLGRTHFDCNNLTQTDLFRTGRNGTLHWENAPQDPDLPTLKLTFMTVHASKGLEADYVIVLNGRSGTWGFPSKLESDPVLSLVTHAQQSADNPIPYSEERRLFYVAMTRTKNHVFFLAPQEDPSEFLLELKDMSQVIAPSAWGAGSTASAPDAAQPAAPRCPICGKALQYHKNSDRIRPNDELRTAYPLYVCSDPNCRYLTNASLLPALPIRKCPSCHNGYLIARSEQGDYLGCTNHKEDKTGCNRTYTFRSEISEQDLRNITKTILAVLDQISDPQPYGLKMLTEVLRGTCSDPRITQNGFDRLPNYGALWEAREADIRNLVNTLVDEGFIRRTDKNTPRGTISVLEPSYPVPELTSTHLHKLKKRLAQSQ